MTWPVTLAVVAAGAAGSGLSPAAVELPDLGAGCQRSFEFITPRRLGGPRYRSASG